MTDNAGMRTTEVYETLPDGTEYHIGTVSHTATEARNRVNLALDVYNEAFQVGLKLAQEIVGDNVTVSGGQTGSSEGGSDNVTDSSPSISVNPKSPGVDIPLGPTESQGSTNDRSSTLSIEIRDTAAARIAGTERIATRTQNTINQECGRVRTVTTTEGETFRARVKTASGVNNIVEYAAKTGVSDGIARYLQVRRSLMSPSP